MAPPGRHEALGTDVVVTVDQMTRALIRYIEGLTLVGGDGDGEPFRLLPWERRFIRGTLSQSGDAALTVARGNGKSALLGAVACAVLDPEGPLHGPRREVVCCASSFSQGRVIFEDVTALLRARYGQFRRKTWRWQDSQNAAILEHRETGSRVRCIGSDPKRAHGLRPYLVLADEPAEWPGATSERMLQALRTGLGKVPGSRLVALGTRPEGSDHWFSRMLAGEAGYAQVHAARREDPPFQLRTIRRANPSWNALPSLQARLLQERAEARISPDALASWRSLRLNMGEPDTHRALILSADLWKSIEGQAEAAGPCVWGIDLGANSAQSAVASYWPDTGRLECVSAFPTVPDLSERSVKDGVGRLYHACRDRGELILTEGRVSDIEVLLAKAWERLGSPSRIVADRWREAELRDALDASGIPACDLEVRGMGFKDGAEDLRAFRRACETRKVTPLPSLLLRAALTEARAVSDPAGNSKLAKNAEGGRRLRAKDDALAAAILGVAAGVRNGGRPRRPRWRYAGVA